MGFRNPLTTISPENIGPGTLPANVIGTELATNSAGNPRVRVYQHPTLPIGVVELDPAVAGDDPAQLTLTTYSRQGDGSSSGNLARLRGSGTGGKTAPDLQLNVVRTGPGAYKSVAQLVGDEVTFDGSLTNIKMATPVVLTNASGQCTWTFPTPFPTALIGAQLGTAGAFGSTYEASFLSGDRFGVTMQIGREGGVLASTSLVVSVLAVGR